MTRGYPDLSHHDYAAESRAMYERAKRDGAADREAGREPNAYLYRTASSDYSAAKGYREGYDGSSPKRPTGSHYRNPRSVGFYDWPRKVDDVTVIPEDILAIAEDILHQGPTQERIARAILAERKRCAEIVRKWYVDLLDDDRVSDSVARRINSGEQP